MDSAITSGTVQGLVGMECCYIWCSSSILFENVQMRSSYVTRLPYPAASTRVFLKRKIFRAYFIYQCIHVYQIAKHYKLYHEVVWAIRDLLLLAHLIILIVGFEPTENIFYTYNV